MRDFNTSFFTQCQSLRDLILLLYSKSIPNLYSTQITNICSKISTLSSDTSVVQIKYKKIAFITCLGFSPRQK